MYEIPYYDLKTLRAVVLNGVEQEHCQQIVQEAVSKVLAFMISEMYLDMRNRAVDFSKNKGNRDESSDCPSNRGAEFQGASRCCQNRGGLC